MSAATKAKPRTHYSTIPEVSVSSADLHRAFRRVSPAVGSRRGGTVRVAATPGGVWLRATDENGLWIDAACPGSASDYGSAVVKAGGLSNVLRVVGGPLRLSADGDTVRIADDDTAVGLAQRPEGDRFDAWPTTPQHLVSLTDADVEAAKAVATVARGDDARPILTCVAFGGGHVVATDLYRLAWAPCSYDGPTFVVPARAVRLLAAGPVQTDRLDEPRWLCWPDGLMGRVAARTVNGDFPNWRLLVPSTTAHTIRVPRGALLTALAHARALNESVEPVVLAPHERGVSVTARRSDAYSYERIIPGHADITVAFSPDYLTSVVRLAATGDDAVLEGKGALGPWRIGADGAMSALIMAVRQA